MNTREVIQPALAAWVLVTLLPFFRDLSLSLSHTSYFMIFTQFYFSAVFQKSGWMNVFRKFYSSRASAGGGINFHECVQSTHAHTFTVTTPPPENSYSSWRLWWDPWSFYIFLKHQRAKIFSLSLSEHKNNFLLLPSEKKSSFFILLLAIFSCMGVWLYSSPRSLSLRVFTLQFFAFFSLLHHIYVREYIEPLNLLHPFMLSCLLARYTRAEVSVGEKFLFFSNCKTYFFDVDDDIELACVLVKFFLGSFYFLF